MNGDDLTAEPEQITRPSLKEKSLNIITIVAEAATGIVGSRKQEIGTAIGRSVQGMIKDNSCVQLKKELLKFQNAGRIDPDYGESQQAYDCVDEIERAIEEEDIDSTKYEALRNASLNIAMERFTSRDDPLTVELLRISSALSSLEILLLVNVWKIFHQGSPPGPISKNHEWIAFVALNSSLKYPELVEQGVSLLEQKRLLNRGPRDNPDQMVLGKIDGVNSRLSLLGSAVCRLICTDPDTTS